MKELTITVEGPIGAGMTSVSHALVSNLEKLGATVKFEPEVADELPPSRKGQAGVETPLKGVKAVVRTKQSSRVP